MQVSRLRLRMAKPWSQILVWTGFAGGYNQYCAILVAINSLLHIFLYAPLAILFIGVIGRSGLGTDVSYPTVATSVAVFLGIPLGAAINLDTVFSGSGTVRGALPQMAQSMVFDRPFVHYLGTLRLPRV